MGIRNIMRAQAALLLTVFLASGCATSSAPKNPLPPSIQPARQAAAMPDGGYTWQGLAELVVTASPDYAAILADARAEYFRYKSRTDLKDPNFSLEYSFLAYDRSRNQYDMQVSLSVPNPFVNRQIIKTGEAARRETETGAEELKNEIAAIIYELTHEILIGERELSVLLLREQVLSGWADYLKMRYDARMATQADLREIEMQRLRLKAAVRQAQFTADTARRSLQALVRIPHEQLVLNPLPSDWKAVVAQLEDNETFIETIFSRSAELAGANAAYEKACAMLGTARAKQIPWLDSVYLSYAPGFTEDINYSYGGTTTSRRNTSKWTAGVNMSLPVFAWFSSEKKMAHAEIEAASLRISAIRERIRNDISGIIADLRGALIFLGDYQSTLDSIAEPTRETIPDPESYFKLMDARLSASEYALKIELQCAHFYGHLLKTAGGWE